MCSPLCRTCSGPTSGDCIICGSGRFPLGRSCIPTVSCLFATSVILSFVCGCSLRRHEVPVRDYGLFIFYFYLDFLSSHGQLMAPHVDYAWGLPTSAWHVQTASSPQTEDLSLHALPTHSHLQAPVSPVTVTVLARPSTSAPVAILNGRCLPTCSNAQFFDRMSSVCFQLL